MSLNFQILHKENTTCTHSHAHTWTHTPTCTHKSTSRKRLFSVVCILGLKNVFWRFSCDRIGNKVSQCRRGSFMSSDCFRWGFMSGDVSLYNYCFCCLREKIGSRALRQRRQHRHGKQNGFKPWKNICYKQTHKTATHKGCLLIWAERSKAGDQSSSKTQNGPAAIIRSARNPTALLSAAQAGV